MELTCLLQQLYEAFEGILLFCRMRSLNIDLYADLDASLNPVSACIMFFSDTVVF